MPKLVLFCACEKLIVDRESNTVSLISLLEDFTVARHDEATNVDAPGVLAPIIWYGFASWEKTDEEDDTTEFEQRMTVRLPNGAVVMEARLSFRFGTQDRMRTYHPVLGFPIHIAGHCTLGLELRRHGEENFNHVASYPMRVVHERVREVSP